MKKWIITIAIGMASSIGVYTITRKQQEKAREFEKHVPYGPYEIIIKRPLDMGVSVIALLFLSPILLIIALLVRINLGSPVLFTQERPGKDERVFKLYKFRTMINPKDGMIDPSDDASRLTPFGQKLRATSLDELPELINIIKGDMSIVGPRPLLTQYLERYNAEQHRRHEVRPGLTGLAQVHGRNAVSWEEKFDWDVQYVKHVSFMEDLKIIIDTVKTVVRREGISDENSVTMTEFMGNEK